MSRQRTRTCAGKVRFRDRKEAQRAMHQIAASSTRDVIPVRAYECHDCRGWHVTSQEKHH